MRVAVVGDVPEGQGRRVFLDGRKVALWRHAGRYQAFGDHCPHMGAALSDGKMQGHRIVCHWHGWSFDARTGACLKEGKEWAAIPVYEVKVDGSDILLRRAGRCRGHVTAPGTPDPGEGDPSQEEDEPWMNWEPPPAPDDSRN